MLILMLLQTAADLEKTAAEDEKAYPMSRVIEKIQNKMAGEDAEDYLDKDVVVAIRKALEEGQKRLADEKPFEEAIVGGIDALDAASFRRIKKNDDLKNLARSKLKGLQFLYPYIHDDRDRAKNRQQQRAITALQNRLWPPKP